MDFFVFPILFAIGLSLGSFINVLTFRYNPESRFLRFDVAGRSHCPHCKAQLRWFELIPLVSFVVQLGRCRHCGRKVSLQYPVVEFLSGALFVAVPFALAQQYGIANILGADRAWFLWSSALWIFTFLLLLALSIIDFREMLIPDEFSLGIAFLGIGYGFLKYHYGKFGFLDGSFLGFYAPIFGFRASLLINLLVAVVVAGALFWGMVVFSRGRAMGAGDAKLVLGLSLLFGWPDILMVILSAFVVGAVVSVVWMTWKGKTMKAHVPFGPFLAAGALLTFFFGFQLMSGYFYLFPIL